MRRAALTWLVLLAAYATTLHVPATPQHRYSSAEAHRLLTAQSIAEDHSLELSDEYADRSYRDFTGETLAPTAPVRDGKLLEPQGILFPVLIAPAYALGGPTLVELECAAFLALAFVLGAGLARRVVPEPWATRTILVAGLSPPALAGATEIAPSAPAAALLAGGALLALRVRDEPRITGGVRAAALLALIPWLGVRLAAPALVVTLALARWLRRRQRGIAGLVALEVVLSSAVVFISVNDRLFGRLVPAADQRLPGSGADPVGAHGISGWLDRVPRLLGVLVDQDAGLLRWWPMAALAGFSVFFAWRSKREQVARAVPGRVDVEVTVALLGLCCLAAVAGAALLAPGLHGPRAVPLDVLVVLPLVGALTAWAFQRLPRASALLAALTLAGSVWLVLGLRLGHDTGLGPPRGPLPWGGIERVLPHFPDDR